MMELTAPIYNSTNIKIFLEYLDRFYPGLDIEPVLESASMTRHEVEDRAHWFNQSQIDRFHDSLVEATGNSNIAREAGRYAVSAQASGTMKQRVLGLINLSSIYLLMGKIYPSISRGATIKTKKLGSNKVEIISTPAQGVIEKPYQCENRMGNFEAAAQLFSSKLPVIEHPLCFHKGDAYCQYIITWERTPSAFWKTVRDYLLIMFFFAFAPLVLTLPQHTWILITSLGIFALLIFSIYVGHLEKKELLKSLKQQGDTAKDHLDEMQMRYNNALLVQEIGQATSTMRTLDELIRTLAAIMEKRLGFDRGAILLSNDSKTKLRYVAGYGYTEDQGKALKDLDFHLDNPNSKGTFVTVFRTREPELLNDINSVKSKFSHRSIELVDHINIKSLICVPILFKNEALGVIAVDNVRSRKSLTQSDINLLMGIASQTAVCIENARFLQKLGESETKYRELVENASSIILRMDTDGKITFFNEFAQKFFGYSESRILGKSIHGIVTPDTDEARKEFELLLNSLRKDPEQHVAREFETILSNGTKAWIAWTYKPIFGKDSHFREVLCIGNDVTPIKRAALENKLLEDQLQRAQKMEAIGTLAGGVAHDLNNILTGLVNYPELMLMQLPEESPLRKPLMTIKRSGDKAAAIVQDLLTLARRGVPVTEVININDIIFDYLKSFEYERIVKYHKNIKTTVHPEQNLSNMLGSPVHLSKTVMNLISNAAEAMPDGGEIIIKTTNMYLNSPIKGYQNVEKGNYAVLSIKDSGVGILPQDIDRIFEPFYTKKVMGRSGTGLGMTVVWGTVKDHHGYIDVRSAVGVGTTFTLYFPATEREIGKDAPSATVNYLAGKNETVLIVDDVEEQREIAAKMLEKLGYSAASVRSGEEAVEYLKTQPANLLLLDMIMDPGIDGLETYKRILELNPNQKAIIASGFSETSRLKEAQSLGATTYLKKPYSLEKLAYAVRNELDKR